MKFFESLDRLIRSSPVPAILTVSNVAASLRVIESVPTATTTSLPTVTGVYSLSPEILSVEVTLKPLIVSLPSPLAY